MATSRTALVLFVVCLGMCSFVYAQPKSRDDLNKRASEKRLRKQHENDGMDGAGAGAGAGEGRQFRTRIVQQVWEKAVRMALSGAKIDELQGLLQHHDKKMLQLKKHQRDGGDPEGETETLLRRRLTEIMQRFGMIPLEDEAKKRKMRGNIRSNETPLKEAFRDAKLNKLWLKVQDTPNFNELELEQLKEELTHHQEKQDMFEHLSEEIYGSKSRDANSVDSATKTLNPGDRSIKELELKLQHREINRDFQMLSSKTIPEQQRGEFVEPRIINLWREASFGNFTEEELESIRVELKHFETKLTNYETMHIQSLHAEKEYRIAKKLGDPADANAHRSLREAAQEIGKTISSSMNRIRGRIQRGRDSADEL